MGNATGGYYTSGFELLNNPEVMPHPKSQPTYDPHLGFAGKRKPRQMLATEEELRAAKIELKERDYCAHLLIKYKSCCKDNWPWAVNCEHQKHEWAHCKYEDFVIRMKEYERERRLREREIER